MLLGVHVSIEGKIFEALERSHKLGCNTMQIFSRNPQRWRDKSLELADIREFNQRREEFKIKPLFIHIPYLINLASPNPGLYEASIKAYIEDIREAQALKADYIVTHMGSHKETSEDEGLDRLTRALNRILQETKDNDVGLLLENTAGSGSWLGYDFTHQRRVIQGIDEKKRIGLCLDTAHAYLAGYNIDKAVGLEETLRGIDKLVGLDMIKLIHLNDSAGKLGSHHDRHENIGKGFIGMAGMKRIVNHPKLRNKPFILETPKRAVTDDAMNLKKVRSFRQE